MSSNRMEIKMLKTQIAVHKMEKRLCGEQFQPVLTSTPRTKPLNTVNKGPARRKNSLNHFLINESCFVEKQHAFSLGVTDVGNHFELLYFCVLGCDKRTKLTMCSFNGYQARLPCEIQLQQPELFFFEMFYHFLLMVKFMNCTNSQPQRPPTTHQNAISLFGTAESFFFLR